MNKKIVTVLFSAMLVATGFAQPTNNITDDEKDYKTAKEFIAKEDYAFAYPLVKQLKNKYPDNKKSDHSYINDDINYYYILCELKLLQDIGKEDAAQYISGTNNEPRRQTMNFHLAHYYFLKNDFTNAIAAYNDAGYENLSNDQIADAKFEKGYALFNLKQFEEAKPLFDEIHQLPSNKYYIPANYYYGFISYYDKQYTNALAAFKLVETVEEYRTVVPYYIAEIYYFQDKKEAALQYAETVLGGSSKLYYDKQLRLLTGQIYFEKKDYQKALPLLEAYVNSADKVSKEILYELSFCYYTAGNTAKAIEGFKQLSNERDSMGQNSMYLLGDLYLKTNQKTNARTAFQYSAFNNSNSLQQKVSRFNYAKLSYELGYEDIALTEMRSFLKSYPSSEYDTEAKEILVALLTKTSNFNDALALYESMPNPTPAMQKVYPRILYGKAIDNINDQQLTKADELLARIMANSNAGNTLPYANFWRGEIAFRQQRYDDAAKFLNTFIQTNAAPQGEANMQAAKYTSGYSFFQKENYKQALTFFEQVARTFVSTVSPLEQDAFLRSADCYYMLRDYAKANSMYDVVVNAAAPQSDYALYQKAMIAGIKNGSEKIRILNTLSKQYPGNNLGQDVNMEIAQTYIADEKFTDAIPFLNNIIASDKDGLKPRAYLKLGLAYYNSNNNGQALTSYNKLIKTYPQSAEADEATDIVKDIYIAEGRPDDYIALMKTVGKAVSLTEADSLSYAAAMAKYNTGDCGTSITAFANYLAKYPAGFYALEANFLRSECYQKNKDWQNAAAGFVAVSEKGNSKYFEKATLEAGRIFYFELKDYASAKKYFEALRNNTLNQDNQLEALRGLVRSYYQLKDYSQANSAAKELSNRKGANTDDKSVALLVLGKSQQVAGDCAAAIASFKMLTGINRSAWGAEGRYEIAHCYFTQNNLAAAEKAALNTIKETGSYDEWVTRSYILLGDIFMQQKDYFNAKATYESVAKNAAMADLKATAQQKYEQAVTAEKASSKISN